MSDLVLYEIDHSVAVITLNRPERMNAMDQPMLKQMMDLANRAELDNNVRAVVLTGAGKGFSSGFDLKAQAANPPSGKDEWRPILRKDFDACMKFWHLTKPTVAAVHGHALAGACELSMACDITVASEDAIFGEPELRFDEITEDCIDHEDPSFEVRIVPFSPTTTKETVGESSLRDFDSIPSSSAT